MYVCIYIYITIILVGYEPTDWLVAWLQSPKHMKSQRKNVQTAILLIDMYGYVREGGSPRNMRYDEFYVFSRYAQCMCFNKFQIQCKEMF